MKKEPKTKGEKTVPKVVQMGMKGETYWEETVVLCRELGIPPTKPLKEVLRKFMPQWNDLLRKDLERKKELDKLKEEIGGHEKK